MDKISIVVPVYGAAAYIEETIQMVQQQTYTEWELILVEDASVDHTKEVIENYLALHPDERIRVCYLEKNGGAARARNKGIELATGDYLAFLDADDIWKEDKLQKELTFLKKENAAFVFTSYEFGNEEAKGTGKFVRVPKQLTYKEALSRTVIFTSTVMIDFSKINRELIKMPLVPSEDSATWWQILRAGHIAVGFDEVLTIYRRPAKSLSSNKIKAIKRIWNLYRKVEHLSLFYSIVCLIQWAMRATLRRI